MVGWHHWRDGNEFEQAPGVYDGEGSLVCCSPWGRKESDITEQLNWTDSQRSKSRKEGKCIQIATKIVEASVQTTRKTIALTRWTFAGKVMSLLFNMLSKSVITFLPRSKHLLISWLQSPSAVILEPRKIKSATVSPSIWHEVIGLDAIILAYWYKI